MTRRYEMPKLTKTITKIIHPVDFNHNFQCNEKYQIGISCKLRASIMQYVLKLKRTE